MRTLAPSGSPADPPTWVAAPPDQLIFTPLDALTAVFDRRSGQTHCLAEPLPQILAMLTAGPTTTAGVLDRLRVQFMLGEAAEAGEAKEAIALIEERLAELCAMGLVSAQ